MPRGLAGGPPFDLSVPHHIVGAPSFAESTLLFLALGAKGWAYNDPPCQSGCSGFMPAASNTSSPAVAIIARDYGFNDPTLCCAKEWGTHSFVRIEIEIGKGGPPALSHGNDCNGGPCTPFMYVDANGCTNFVAFAPVKGPDGQTFDYPYIAGQICSGTSAVNTAGSGDGGGVGVNGKPAIAPCPSKTVQFFADVVVGANPAMLAAQKLAQKTGGVVQLGAGFTGTIGLSGIPGLKLVPILNKLGIGASASVSWVFDKAGNVGLAFSAGPAAGVGGGAVMGGQLSLSLAADSIFDIAGRSTSFGIGGGEGVGVAIEGSNNAYGTASATVGLGEGGFALLPGGSYTNTGLIPLVCK